MVDDQRHDRNKYLILGSQIMITLITPIIAGWLIDLYLHTEPWGLVAGVVAGFVAVMMLLVSITRNI